MRFDIYTNVHGEDLLYATGVPQECKDQIIHGATISARYEDENAFTWAEESEQDFMQYEF